MKLDLQRSLIRPIPTKHVQQKNGYDYAAWHYKWARVIYFCPDAEWTVKRETEREDGSWFVVGTLTIDGVSRDGVGYEGPSNHDSGGSDVGVKAATSDALSRACTMHGIGLELYGTDTSAFQKPRNGEKSDDKEGE